MTPLLTAAKAVLTHAAQAAITSVAATVTVVKSAVNAVAQTTQTLWALHQRFMDGHGLYRAVVTALAGVLLRQVDLQRFILALVAAFLRYLTRPGRHPAQFGFTDAPYPGHYGNDDGDDEGPQGWAFA